MGSFRQGVEMVDNEYFITEDNVGMLKLAKEANSILVRRPNKQTMYTV